MKKMFLALTLVFAFATNVMAALESQWDCGEWGKLTMYQSGTEISGEYDFSLGGSITGTFVPAANIISGYWKEVAHEADHYCGPGNGYEGPYEFKVFNVGDKFWIKGDYSDCVGTMPDWQNGNWNCEMLSGEFDMEGLLGEEPLVEFMQLELTAQDTELYPGDTVKVDAFISGNGTGDLWVVLEYLGSFYFLGSEIIGMVPAVFHEDVSVTPSNPVSMTVMNITIPTDAILTDLSTVTLYAAILDDTGEFLTSIETIDFQLYFK